ncbi:MAG TPA: hypothetical protein VL463_02280 [Kofleriaceae bacterium]|nr:hypothetical protein [Kofleriaceae bacterium]
MLAFGAGVVRGIFTKHPTYESHDHGSKDDRLDGFDTPARRKAIEGAWIVRDGDTTGFSSDYSQPLAISIEGDKAQLWNGRAMQTAHVKFDSPCAFALMKPDPNGGESGSIYTFAVHDGTAELLEGDGGEREGDRALVCADHGVYLLDAAGDCSRFESFFGTSKPSKCGFRKEKDGKEVFFYDGDPDFKDHENKTLPVDGWRIGESIDPDVKNGALFHRYKSFDEARAVVDKDAHDNDPLLIAQAAGGKVGDTTTVPGLVATFANDRDKLEDQVVKVTGVVVVAGDHGVVIAAVDHRDRPTLQCDLGGEVELHEGAVITVEGKVRANGDDTWTMRPFAVPSLDECKVVASLPVP